MPACVKHHNCVQTAFLLICIMMAGCTRQADDRHFELGPVDANWSDGQLRVTVHQELKLSSEAREALVHGVPLTLQLELLLRHPGNAKRVKRNTYSYEIRYLPLISHYQLTQPGAVELRTYPRLRYLLAELSTIKLSFAKGELPPGNYELMARTYLDQKKMPPPMRLPMLFSAQWQHDTDWTKWPVGNTNGN